MRLSSTSGLALILTTVAACGNTQRDFDPKPDAVADTGGSSQGGSQGGNASSDPSAGAESGAAGATASGEGSQSGGAGGDPTGGAAGATARDCDFLAPFEEPTLVSDLNVNTTGREGKPTLTTDGLAMLFASNRGGNYGIYIATRTSLDDRFGDPKAIAALAPDETLAVRDPMMSDDRLTIFYGLGSGYFDIYASQWSAATASWAEPQSVGPAINKEPLSSASPFLTADGGRLYFVADSLSGRSTDNDVFYADRTSDFTNVTAVRGVNTEYHETSVAVSADELTVYFSTNRPHAGARGRSDIWFASRANANDDFSDLRPVPELSSHLDDFAGWVSPDGCQLYMSREDGNSADIYVARKQR